MAAFSAQGATYAGDLSAFMGREVSERQAETVIAIVSAQARGYTRGRGWDTNGEPYGDVRAVILTAAARLLTDTSQITSQRAMGPFSVSYRNGFDGWTVSELYVLNRYRQRAR